MLTTSGLIFTLGANVAQADSHEGEQLEPASPIELFTCKYNEGMGPADYDAAVEKFNDWADEQGLDDYTAWRLAPYYSGPEQEFDTIWLGGSPSSASMGRAQDAWLATGGKVQDAFNAVSTCDAHVNFATLQFKTPPKRENPGNVVISFTDCTMADGVKFDDLVSPLMAWAEYREGHGSSSGMWVLFPAYGGGGEEFDFKFVASWQNLEEQGADYDQYNQSGWEKANELFEDKVSCDSARVYLATNLRMAADDDE